MAARRWLLRRFNGAAAFRPRKCGNYADNRDSYERLQWGRGLSAAEMLIGQLGFSTFGVRFNGAAAFRPRKWRCSFAGRRGRPSFNGAAAFRPRKCYHGWTVGEVVRKLQWGRGLSAAAIRP